jgi:septal ring factor EnvC (AmiA/AmiB activator)
MNEIERIPVGDSLQDKYNKLRSQLLDTRHELIQKDYAVQNQKNIIENLKKTLERYERENRAMRELLALWI